MQCIMTHVPMPQGWPYPGFASCIHTCLNLALAVLQYQHHHLYMIFQFNVAEIMQVVVLQPIRIVILQHAM